MNVRLHILPSLGRLTFDEITSEQVTNLINDMRGNGYAAGTTNNGLMLLCRIFNMARKWKLPGVGDNPAVVSTAPVIERQRFLTAEETSRLIASLAEDETAPPHRPSCCCCSPALAAGKSSWPSRSR
jgi:hypothetical protein